MIESSADNVGRFNVNRTLLLSVILVLNAIGAAYYYHFFYENGYLPSPFINDKSDTFMDMFNVMYWAYDDDRYAVWASVYPPLNFIFLKFINFIFADGWVSDPFVMRDNSSSTIIFFVSLYLILPFLVIATSPWKIFNRAEKAIIYFIVILSTPMLFALERGNLVILAPIFLALTLCKNNFLRMLAIALLINIKPYFGILLLLYISKRSWGELLSCMLMAGSIFVLTGIAIDSHFLLFFTNLLSFSGSDEIFSLRELMSMPSSISAFSSVLKSPDGYDLAISYISPTLISYATTCIEILKWAVVSLSLCLMFKKAKVIGDDSVLFLLVVVIMNVGIWTGGYTMIFYMAFIPLLATIFNSPLFVGLAILIALPLDMLGFMQSSIGIQDAFLSGESVEVFWTLGLGSLIRPVCNIVFLIWLIKTNYTKEYDFVNRSIVKI